jgi:6-phosphogluconolactonase
MLKSAQTIIDVQSDPDAVAGKVADWLLDLSVKNERVTICLSGGSTPKLLYETLASKPFCDQFKWDRVHWFWGDERYVPHGDPLSNFKMVKEAMLSKVPVPPANIHAIPTSFKDPKQAASAYQKELQSHYGAAKLDPERPLFDVTLLGLGPDGHTASLFPKTKVLDERLHWVEAVIGAKPEVRITLTYPALESSAAVAFLVTGREKKEIASRVLIGAPELPASGVRPVGTLYWFFDQAAHPQY